MREFYFLYSRFLLVIYYIHISIYMSIPISQFIPPPPTPPPLPPLSPAWCPYVCSMREFWNERFPTQRDQNCCLSGLPWWRSGWESACQCRGHGFEPWSGKIPHTAEQLSPWATTTEPAHLDIVLRNGRLQQWEARAPRWRVAPTCHNLRKPTHRNEDPTQPKINNKIIN